MENSKPSKRTIDDEIDHVLERLQSLSPDSKEYEAAVKNLELLYQAKGHIKLDKPEKIDDTKLFGISKETLLMAATNILGIGLILNYEQMHVISSKALQFILKSRVT